jgi:stage V sporulation protein B
MLSEVDNMSRRSFLHGAMTLMVAGLVTRVLGFIYRIVLTRMVGAAGMGLFQMVFPLLSLVLTFVTAGLPVAISKLVAEAMVGRDRVRVKRILRVSTVVILSMAVIFTILMWLLRGLVQTYWLTDARAYPTYLAMIPIVTIIAISSIYRGYFQGLQDMSPPAWASILETVVRIISIWILAAYFIQFSLPFAAAAAMMGMVLGELTGLLWLMVQYRRKGRLSIVLSDAPERSLETSRQTLYAIVQIAAPVTFSRLIGSLIYAIEPVLVTRSLLAAGFSTSTATILYGQYGGMAIPLLVFPTVFTGSLAVNLVPAVSEAIAGDQRSRIHSRFAQTWTATALVGLPTSVILTLYAEPLCYTIFGEHAVGPILAVMAPAGFLLYLQGPLAGILQGLNRAGIAMRNSIIGGVLRLVFIYLLASNPHFGILGVAWALTLSVSITTALHFISVYRNVGFSIPMTDTIKIVISSLVMLVFLTVLSHQTTDVTATQLLFAVASGFLLYFILLCSLQVLTSRRVRKIPKIGKWLAPIVSAMPFAI